MCCRLVVLLFLSITVPSVTVAQAPPLRRVAVFVGAVAEGGDEAVELGARVGTAVTVFSRPSKAIRVDASYQIFGGSTTVAPCQIPGCTSTGHNLRMLQLGVTAAFSDRNGVALTAGTGAYDVLESPNDGSYIAPGWSLGLNAPIGVAGFMEIGWHGLVGPGATRGFGLLGFGLRF
jgi:hypothetical protein